MLSVILVSAAFLLGTTTAQDPSQVFHHDKLVVCYIGTWSIYRSGLGQFDIRDIDPTLCTHVVYAFAALDADTNQIKMHDSNRDITRKGYQEFIALKEKNPKLKTLIAIGGWTEGAEKYSWMADGEKNRTTFINSVIVFINMYKFDGLDLDWEYPAAVDRGGRPQDKENFASLVTELHHAFSTKGWLLTAALGSSPDVIKRAYDIPTLNKYLDIFNIMCYDYHGNWETEVGHNAPLYSRPDESFQNKNFNLNTTINLLLSEGASPAKIALGLPFYGHTFKLNDSALWKPGSLSEKSSGRPGKYSNQTGFMGYNEFCEINSEEQWTIMRDEHQKVPYAYKDNDWFSFDDAESLRLKTEFALSKNLGGIMIWSIETDDFNNVCKTGRYPLLRAVNDALATETNTINVVDTNSDKVTPIATDKPNNGNINSLSYLLVFLLCNALNVMKLFF